MPGERFPGLEMERRWTCDLASGNLTTINGDLMVIKKVINGDSLVIWW
jgi:hypothetical protein